MVSHEAYSKSALRTNTTLGDPAVIDAMYEPMTVWPRQDLPYLRLNDRYSFELGPAVHYMEELKAKHGFEQLRVSGDKKKFTYRGLGLTSRPNVEDPLYDSLKVYSDAETVLDVNELIHSTSERAKERKLYTIRETAFTEKTDACIPFFDNIVSRFRSPLMKVRLLELKPGGVLTSHIDFPYYEGIRIHAVLTRNDDCWWEVDGHRFQLPADGNFYWMDVGKYHSVWNFGSTPRVVLSVNLSVYKNRDGTSRYTPYTPLKALLELGMV